MHHIAEKHSSLQRREQRRADFLPQLALTLPLPSLYAAFGASTTATSCRNTNQKPGRHPVNPIILPV
jgi:hypothetical protein